MIRQCIIPDLRDPEWWSVGLHPITPIYISISKNYSNARMERLELPALSFGDWCSTNWATLVFLTYLKQKTPTFCVRVSFFLLILFSHIRRAKETPIAFIIRHLRKGHNDIPAGCFAWPHSYILNWWHWKCFFLFLVFHRENPYWWYKDNVLFITRNIYFENIFQTVFFAFGLSGDFSQQASWYPPKDRSLNPSEYRTEMYFSPASMSIPQCLHGLDGFRFVVSVGFSFIWLGFIACSRI